MKAKELGALFALAALWGASFLFMRIAAPLIGPLLTIQGRVTIGALVLFPIVWMTKTSLEVSGRWKQFVVLGALNSAIPFSLFAVATLHVNASMAAILNSLAPLFAALILWIWKKERLSPRKWAGILMGIAGVVLLAGWSPVSLTWEVLISIGLCVIATICYGIAGIYAKDTFAGVPPLSVTVGQLFGASLFLSPFTLWDLSSSATVSVSPVALWSVLGLAVLCTSVAYLFYFYLIERAGPAKALSVTFLIPLFGIVWGAIFLQEKITGGMILGLVVILGSIFLISDLPLPSVQKKHVAGAGSDC
jgi:drug/metabolite transporter (DMT)-like permease